MSKSQDYDYKEDYGYGGSPYDEAIDCPFCGHHVLRIWKRSDGNYVVKCGIHLCGVEGPPRLSGRKAVAAWNIRRTKKTIRTVGRLA